MLIVENIKNLCKQHRTSIPKLEVEFGFGHGAVYGWDTSTPGVDKVKKIADYFGVSIEFLLSGTDQAPPPFTIQTILKLAKDNRANIGTVISVLDEAKSAVLSGVVEKTG